MDMADTSPGSLLKSNGLIPALSRILGGRRFMASRPRRAATAGVTSLEFAMVGGTYGMLLLGVFLFGIYFLRIVLFDMAVVQATRAIMIGQSVTQTQLVSNIKSKGFGLLDDQTIYVAVQSAASFDAIAPVANISTGAGGTVPFNPGTFGSYVLVQAGYDDNLLAAIFPRYVTNVVSTIPFQNEPNPL